MNSPKELIEVHGNTYAIKDSLKALGARWDGARKCWLITEAKVEGAKQIDPSLDFRWSGRTSTPRKATGYAARMAQLNERRARWENSPNYRDEHSED